jgi:hypothetical protein
MATRKGDELAPLDRLVDASHDSPGEAAWIRARAVELVQSLDPFQAPKSRKQRVLLSLGQGWVRRGAMWLQPVTMGALLIGSGAIASAALTSWPARIVRSWHSTSSARPPAARAMVTGKLPAADSIRPAVAAKIASTIDSKIASAPPPAPVRRLTAEAHSRRPSFAAPSDDPSLVIEATRALRVDRDPKLARALASRYLERQPAGALVDEALAISIEAAVEHRDPDAPALARKYLAEFPRGAFRSLARRTLAPPDRR